MGDEVVTDLKTTDNAAIGDLKDGEAQVTGQLADIGLVELVDGGVVAGLGHGALRRMWARCIARRRA